MGIENTQWLTAVVHSHPRGEVIGRTRLQKTIWLLQRLGLPTDYVFSLHFYGPYSEEIKADIWLAEQFGLLTETPKLPQDGTEYFVLTAKTQEGLPNFAILNQCVQLWFRRHS